MDTSFKMNYTKNNQDILRSLAAEITTDVGAKNVRQETTSMWGFGWLTKILPSSEKVGYTLGENLGWTHGAKVSNFAVDVVVGQFFQTPAKSVSMWSFEGLKKAISGVAEVSVAEGAKLAITPRVLPAISVMAAVGGSIAVPAVICLVSQIYSRITFNPEEAKKLAKLSIGELFTIDPETGRFRDAFGGLLTEQDMKDVLNVTAQYDLIFKLNEATKKIDDILGVDIRNATPAELQSFLKNSGVNFNDIINQANGFADLEELHNNKAREILETILDVYKIPVQEENGEILFVDGSVLGEKEKKKIEEGIDVLLRINPTHAQKHLRKLIRLLAKHAALPVETLSVNDKIQVNEIGVSFKAKRMPAVFTDENEWKNSIIFTETGKFVVIADVGDKKKGTVISSEEMNTILDELDAIQKQMLIDKKQALEALMFDPKKHTLLAQRLKIEKAEVIQHFIKSFVVESEDGITFLDGSKMSKEEVESFKMELFCLNLNSDRQARIEKLIKTVSAHFPTEEKLNAINLSLKEGKFMTENNHELSREEVAICFKQIREAEIVMIQL